MRGTRRRKRDHFLPWVQLFADAAMIYWLLYTAFWFRFQSLFFENGLGEMNASVYYRSFHLITIILILFLRLYGLYQSAKFLTFSHEVSRIVKAVVASTLVFMTITFFIRGFSFSRTFLVLAGGVLAAGISFARYFLGLLIMWVDKKRGSLRNILVVGCNESGRKLVHFYKKNPRFSTRVSAFLDDNLPRGVQIEGVPVIGRTEELGGILKAQRDVHEVMLAIGGLSTEAILKVISDCEKQLVTFRWVSDIFGLIASKMSVSYAAGVPILSFTDSPLSDWENRFLKRATDVLVSAAALVLLSPVFLLITFLIKLDSAGPVFYRQVRVGEDGRRFTLLKFRTMREDAERESGPVWAKENDPRRTRSGTFLRENNLDELPQLWNVLKGDMSLVGPRPERPHFVSRFKEDIPRYMARHTIRSGITGWAQVNGLRGNTSIEERTKFDLYYIENWSLLFDMKILLRTLFAKNNAY